MPVNNPTTIEVSGQPALAGNITLQQSGTVTLSQTGNVITISATGGGGGTTWTEGEVDFGSKPIYDTVFTIIDASISSTSKIVVEQSGKVATGRVASGDGAWDSISYTALPGTGSAQVWAKASPGPVVGKRKFQYTVA
jgi:hypothetical protein